MLDRIDLQIEVPRLKTDEVFSGGQGFTPGQNQGNSATIKSRVMAARQIQQIRFGRPGFLNSHLKGREIKKFIRLDESGQKILVPAAARFFLSYRAIEKILKVSRTIADLEGAEQITTVHLTEALNYRLFKNYF